MTITISSAFDAGNIRVAGQDGDRVDLEIVKDHLSDFYQWFYFRVAGAAGREVTLRIVNCEQAAYPNGWPGYKAVMSLDREEWVRIEDTRYEGGILSMTLTAPQDVFWIAYFAPYSMERHHDLIAETAACPAYPTARSARASTARTSTASTSATASSTSGSMLASTPARPWPNGGWKARSRN